MQTTPTKPSAGAIRAAQAILRTGEGTHSTTNTATLAAIIDRETGVDKHREALAGMLENYIELKRISLMVAKSDAPNWIGAGMTVEDDIHVRNARQALANL